MSKHLAAWADTAAAAIVVPQIGLAIATLAMATHMHHARLANSLGQGSVTLHAQYIA